MTNEKRLIRIEELKIIINSIMGRGKAYRGKTHLRKESLLRIKQCHKAIVNHTRKLN